MHGRFAWPSAPIKKIAFWLTTSAASPKPVDKADQVATKRPAQRKRSRGQLPLTAFATVTTSGRIIFYAEVKAGRIRPVKMGRKTLIPEPEGERWLASLPTAEGILKCGLRQTRPCALAGATEAGKQSTTFGNARNSLPLHGVQASWISRCCELPLPALSRCLRVQHRGADETVCHSREWRRCRLLTRSAGFSPRQKARPSGRACYEPGSIRAVPLGY